MIEDKKYPVEVTDDMILRYENMVYNVYYRFYRHFSYLKDDLLQCGRWGVFLAYQRYERQARNKCEFSIYVWLHIRNKMYQYIDHEKHHITKETNDFDFSRIEHKSEISETDKIDIDRALSKLNKIEKDQIIRWANYGTLQGNDFNNRQTANNKFKKTLNTLRRMLK